jgi:hypothetical protein
MRILAVLIVLLALPAAAVAKGGDHGVHVNWLSAPDGTRAGGTWHASFEFLDPNGNRLIMDNVRPIVIATSDGAAISADAAFADVPGRYAADVRFPSAGRYEVALARFDPRDPHRFLDMGPPVAIGAAMAPHARRTGFPWPLLIVFALAVPAVLLMRRTRLPPASSRARPAAGAPPDAG